MPTAGAAVPSAKLDTALRVETPEGIDMLLRPAGVPARAMAYGFDWLIRFMILGVAMALLAPLAGFGAGLGAIFYFALEWLYPIVFELLPGAATPGKRALGLQVILDSGLPITPGASIARNLLRAADFLPFAFGLGLLSMLLRPDFKRIGDVAAGTLVVHRDDMHLHAALPPAEPLPPAIALSRAGQVAILHLAGRAARLTPERVDELARLAAPALPQVQLAPARAAPPPLRPGPRLLAVAQWLAGQR